MCNFNKYEAKDLKNEEYISFCLVGDTQVGYNDLNSREGKEHHKANLELVNILNKFKSSTDINDFSMDDYMKKFIMESKKNLIGVIHAGDLVNWVTDSRFIATKNSIAMNNYVWQNNPTDGGLLQIPLYEVLGNHDFTGIGLWYRPDGSPSLNVHKQRVKSKNYVVNIDEKYGHYSCDFGNLHIIFINGTTHPGTDGGVADDEEIDISGVKFLEQDLSIHGYKPFYIVTHFSGRVLNWDWDKNKTEQHLFHKSLQKDIILNIII